MLEAKIEDLLNIVSHLGPIRRCLRPSLLVGRSGSYALGKEFIRQRALDFFAPGRDPILKSLVVGIRTKSSVDMINKKNTLHGLKIYVKLGDEIPFEIPVILAELKRGRR